MIFSPSPVRLISPWPLARLIVGVGIFIILYVHALLKAPIMAERVGETNDFALETRSLFPGSAWETKTGILQEKPLAKNTTPNKTFSEKTALDSEKLNLNENLAIST